MKWLLVVLCCLPTSSLAQRRFLVSPNDKIYPLHAGESAADAMRRMNKISKPAPNCDTVQSSKFNDGYDEKSYPGNSLVDVHHKDVVAEWFVAKAPGMIDSIYWETPGAVGAKDSLVEIRLYYSNIYPGRGPGFAPYPAPCAQWGYYYSANDLDRGITPYRDEATDTNWVSTSFFGPRTFDPLGAPLWDGNGYKVVSHAEAINAIAMDDFGDKPHVIAGDRFFISLRVNSQSSHSADSRTQFGACDVAVATGDSNYPSRNWVFFEHDSSPTICGLLPGSFVRQGWIALGDESIDSLNARMLNIWYTMTTDPYVPNAGELTESHEIAGDSLTICLNACDPSLVDTTKETWIKFYSGYSNDSLPFPLTHQHPLCISMPVLAESTTVCYDILQKNSPPIASVCLQILGVNDGRAPLPTSTALLQNYPNPFNPSTNFGYRISNREFVQLKVYDVLGREMATLVNEAKEPGTYSVSWNASGVPSGVYYYKLSAGTFIDVKKMILLR